MRRLYLPRDALGGVAEDLHDVGHEVAERLGEPFHDVLEVEAEPKTQVELFPEKYHVVVAQSSVRHKPGFSS